MTGAVDTAVCQQCGMPLAYDRLVTADAQPSAVLCSYCTNPQRPRGFEPPNGSPAVLHFLLQTYLRDRRWVRALAAIVRRAGIGPQPIRQLADIVGVLPHRGADRPYDALVLYSGGKDSSTMLAGLVKTGLKLCAWMLDQGYQSPAAIANARALCERLGVPLVIERPNRRRMDSLFRVGFGITNAADAELVKSVAAYGSACWPCFSTIAARAAAFCNENRIPFCFVGTQPGQNRLDLNGQPGLAGIIPRTDNVVRRFVAPLRAYAERIDADAATLLELDRCETLLLPYFEFVPLPDRQTQLLRLQEIGWKMPKNTGACSTNCMMNELGRFVMRKRFGFDLYQIIEANERRMRNAAGPAPDPAPVDMEAVIAGQRMMGLSKQESEDISLSEPQP